MTDEHSPDQDPLHEDASHEEHASAHVESAGTWSDDHPPVDDFSDTATASEEAATVSEEVSEEASGEEAPPSAAPSRSMLPLFAGIGGILLVGAMIYWQFGHSSPPAVMNVQTQAPKSAAVLPPSSTTPATKSVVAPVGSGKVAESDITALYKAPPEPAPLAIPAPSSTLPTTATVAPSVTETPPSQVSPSVPLPPPAPVVVSALPAPSADARVDRLVANVNDLQKSVETTTQEINKLTTMMAATQAMPPVPGQANPVLENRLNKIEQSLQQIEHNQVAKPAPVAAAISESEATSEVVTKSVSHHKKPVKHKPIVVVHKKTAHQPVSLMAQAPVMASNIWVLRAATPGEAWVAADAHTAELKHVQVGDSLSGIGTIRSIRQTPGGWEIEGATGTIR